MMTARGTKKYALLLIVGASLFSATVASAAPPVQPGAPATSPPPTGGGAGTAPPATTTSPASGTEAEARSHYSRGVELYNDGVYGAALAELERAQQLAPHYGILHSIGLVKVQLADFVGALNAFEQYLVAGGEEISPQRKQEIRDKINQLQERIGTVEISVPFDGAEVVLDDAIVGLTPLAKPMRVNPGKHEIIARRPGEKGDVKKVSVAGGDKLKIVFDMSGSGKTLGERQQEQVSGTPKWVASTWIATGAFAIAATTTGIIGLTKANDLEKLRNDGPNDSKVLNEKSTEVSTWATVTDVLIVPAVLLAAISLYFTVRPNTPSTDNNNGPTTPSASGSTQSKRSSPPSRSGPTLSFGGKMGVIGGTF